MAIDLFVRVNDAQGAPLGNVTGSWRRVAEEGAGVQGQREAADQRLRLPGVPEQEEFVLHLSRPGAVELDVFLNLSLSGDRRFTRGRPTVMNLQRLTARQRGTSSSPRYQLDVAWYEPQEVILCSGADTHNRRRSPFLPIAYRRFRRMVLSGRSASQRLPAGVVGVAPSCVLTLFEFNGDQSRRYHFLPGRGTRPVPGHPARPAVVLMRSSDAGPLSVMDVYSYLAQAGRSRPGTVIAVEFLSHAYWIGPVLENTSRGSPTFCSEHCPVRGQHGATVMQLPRHIPYLRYNIDAQARTGYLTANPRVILVPREAPSGGGLIQHASRAATDKDPRNTDFALLRRENIENMKRAMHPRAILRVWGCSNGDLGPRFRALARQSTDRQTNENRLMTIDSNYDPHPHPLPSIRQTWRVRWGDARFIYLSQARRCYAQAIADALDRPCFAAVPGTWAEYQATPTLGGMRVFPTTVATMRRFARQQLGLDQNDEDEAGYFRFSPTAPAQRANVNVLVTGFEPFGIDENGQPRRHNASSDAVALLVDADIQGSIDIPPWIEPAVNIHRETNVRVVWTCPAAPAATAQAAGRLLGGLGILEKARQLDAAIVVVVGETRRSLAHLRVEQYATNYGTTTPPDNSGNHPRASGPIFPGKPETIESMVPRRTWANVIRALLQAGLGVHIPEVDAQRDAEGNTTSLARHLAGEYICNESLYRLMLDARQGDSTRGSAPSGRWVLGVHVGAYRDESTIRSLARGISVVIRTLIADMLWATEIYGLQGRVRAP